MTQNDVEENSNEIKNRINNEWFDEYPSVVMS